MKKSSLDRMIDSVPVAAACRCGVCGAPRLADVVLRWLDRRAAGEVLPPLEVMHRGLFARVGDVSVSSVRRHCRDCLRRDHKTGRKL